MKIERLRIFVGASVGPFEMPDVFHKMLRDQLAAGDGELLPIAFLDESGAPRHGRLRKSSLALLNYSPNKTLLVGEVEIDDDQLPAPDLGARIPQVDS